MKQATSQIQNKTVQDKKDYKDKAYRIKRK